MRSNLLVRVILFLIAISYPSVYATLKVDVTLQPASPEVGENALSINLVDEKGKVVEGATLHLSVSMPAMGAMPRMEETAKITEKGKGQYTAEFSLAMGGSWELSLAVEKGTAKEIFSYSLTTGIPGLTNKTAPKVDASPSATPLLSLGPDRIQKIGVRFAEAKMMSLQKVVRAVGIVEHDNTNRSEVSLRFAGYVQKQLLGRIGDLVKAGSPLFTVYSPDLVAAQEEFLLVHHHHGGDEVVQASTRERLKNLGISDTDISRIKAQGKALRELTISAPQAGTILEITVREGSSFAQGQLLYAIGDLSKNYIVARVFQRDLSYLKVGQTVDLQLPESKQARMQGKIDLIYPNIAGGEGTGNVRVAAASPELALKPGFYVPLQFPIELGQALAVPAQAVLYSGLHTYAFVDHGQGVLEPREIITGKTTDQWVEVVSGLKEGERVVESGTFLISSEASLRSALSKWVPMPAHAQGAPTHHHH